MARPPGHDFVWPFRGSSPTLSAGTAHHDFYAHYIRFLLLPDPRHGPAEACAHLAHPLLCFSAARDFSHGPFCLPQLEGLPCLRNEQARPDPHRKKQSRRGGSDTHLPITKCGRFSTRSECGSWRQQQVTSSCVGLTSSGCRRTASPI